MGNRDKKKKKKTRREERLRQEKHERKSQPQVEMSDDDRSGGGDPFDDDTIPLDHRDADGLDDPGDGFSDKEDDFLSEVFGHTLSEEGYWGDGYGLEDPKDEAYGLSGASRFDTERAFRHLAKTDGGRKRDDLSAIRDYWEERSHYDEDAVSLPADPVERAQELAYQAMETRNALEIKRLAQEALTFDPDCVDALGILAFLNHAESADCIRAFEQIVAVGERTLGGAAFFEAQKGRFFTLVETRPYMRAREHLANLLAHSGRIPEATAHYEALLELDSCDHQHLRALLLCRYLETDRMDAAKRIMERFPQGRPVYIWARVLGFFLTGDRPSAGRLSNQAMYLDDTLEAFLQEDDESMTLPDTSGGVFEKPNVLALALRAAWRKHPAALQWLRDGAPGYSAEEVRQCRESFRPPVLQLLSLGEPKEKPWRDYRTKYGLTGEHIPDLIRMATAYALEESKEKNDCFALVHACRALAQLEAQEAIAPLLRHFASDLDDFSKVDFPELFARLGPAAIPGLRELLAGMYDPEVRRAAARAISRIGQEHPDAKPRCIEVLMEQLRGYRMNLRTLNASLCELLEKMNESEAEALLDEVWGASAARDESGLFEDY